MFMYVAMQNGHDPYEVPDIYKDQYSHIENEDRRALAGLCYGILTFNSVKTGDLGLP